MPLVHATPAELPLLVADQHRAGDEVCDGGDIEDVGGAEGGSFHFVVEVVDEDVVKPCVRGGEKRAASKGDIEIPGDILGVCPGFIDDAIPMLQGWHLIVGPLGELNHLGAIPVGNVDDLIRHASGIQDAFDRQAVRTVGKVVEEERHGGGKLGIRN